MATNDYLGLASSAIQTAGSVAGTIYAANEARAATEDEYRYQSMLNQQQNEWNEKMWDKNNAYNDPSAQLARYLSTGMNPGTAIQAVSGNHYNAVQAQAQSSPGVSSRRGEVASHSMSSLVQSLGTFMSNLLTEKQIKKTESETTGQNIKNLQSPQAFAQELTNMRSLNEKTIAEAQRITEETKKLRTDNKYNEKEHEQQLANLKQQIIESDERIKNMHSQIELSRSSVLNEYERTMIQQQVADFQEKEVRQRIELLRKEGVKIDAELEKLLIDTQIAEYNSDVSFYNKNIKRLEYHMDKFFKQDFMNGGVAYMGKFMTTLFPILSAINFSY